MITLLVVVLSGGACGSGSSKAGSTSQAKPNVVAAENFWGSIVRQLAGDKADVTSIISNPDTDPHAYEATAGDNREIASAKYVVYNGIGYDAWAKKALDADPGGGRTVLEVGKLLGLKEGPMNGDPTGGLLPFPRTGCALRACDSIPPEECAMPRHPISLQLYTVRDQVAADYPHKPSRLVVPFRLFCAVARPFPRLPS